MGLGVLGVLGVLRVRGLGCSVGAFRLQGFRVWGLEGLGTTAQGFGVCLWLRDSESQG